MTKDRILSAAKAVLESAGFEGLTIRRVAQRAGLSPMALYRHFKNKDELLNALMQDGISAWEAIVRGIRAQDPVKWLEALMEAYLDFALKQPHRFDAAFFLRPRRASSPTISPRAARRRLHSRWLASIRRRPMAGSATSRHSGSPWP